MDSEKEKIFQSEKNSYKCIQDIAVGSAGTVKKVERIEDKKM